MSETRLDIALAERGIARSRTQGARLILDGAVTVNGRQVSRPSVQVTEMDVISVLEPDHYVSRAAHKLVAALDAFQIEARGRLAMDVGASTGGFTQVLLERGARRVLAVDVGHGQLAPRVAADPRVVAREGVNARELTGSRLGELFGSSERPDLIVADLSFISLKHVLPALVSVAAPAGDVVLLVKPQFEVGRGGTQEGIVRSAALRADAMTGVMWSAFDLGLGTAGIVSSPIEGSKGNKEYLVWLSESAGRNPTEWMDRATRMTGE